MPTVNGEILYEWEDAETRVQLISLGAGSDKPHSFSDRPVIGYRLFDDGKLIFEGDQYRPAPSVGIASDGAVMHLLGFLTLKPGDTDPEYFDAYTSEQLAWCQSMRAEELSLMVDDWEHAR